MAGEIGKSSRGCARKVVRLEKYRNSMPSRRNGSKATAYGGGNLLDDLEEVRNITERWLEDYNTIRPHEALQGLPPRLFAQQHA
jgi:putative transposase